MLRRGDSVEILSKFQDAGDNDFAWTVLNDEEKGRVDIAPIDIRLEIKTNYALNTSQIELAMGAFIETHGK